MTFDEPGEYTYNCDVHPAMESAFAAVDQPLEGEETTEYDPDEGS